MNTDSAGDVGETALGAALMRAQESAQPDALIHDPYAAAFVAAAPRPFDDVPDPDGRLAELEVAFRADVAIRTRFFDDFALSACARGIRQVVLLGAGLDSRAFRLDWPSDARVFELDLPGVLAFKDSVLQQESAAPRCLRSTVAVDLRDNWVDALVGGGFDVGARSAWCAEGVVAYLTPDEAVALFETVTRLCTPASELAFERASTSDDSALATTSAIPSMGDVASMWHETSAGVAPWLREHGWTTTTHDRADLARRYRREPGPTTAEFVTATLGE
jgi:methyltransferase (TIGR00027 family)